MADPIFSPAVPEFITVDGLRIRFIRTDGEGTPILLTAPWPQSIYAFHGIWSEITPLGPVIALDLPGFGRSEGRPDLMSPQAMGDFLVRFARALSLQRVHAVGPDVGTSALLFAAHSAPDLFESITIGSGGARMDLVGAGLRGVIEAAPGSFGEEDGGPQVVATITRNARHLPPKEAMEDFRASSAGRRWIEAAEYVRAYPRGLARLGELLPSIEAPVLVISGRDDPIVPPSNGDYLAEFLPAAVNVIVAAGHYVWEDAPEEYAALIRDWVQGGHRDPGRFPAKRKV
ncbi:alpha/beta fold hydrolase [Sphingomonas kyeonggiensis]|uniref:Pimeloyl-ACP methyl ester carboxylesterase n=1 Tax=Sphingomonas kyeonggiensis TaxID=1268553 RepID=A0A7W6JT57_9SPHN|nr:alpha/beta hydrolase [Sphingomonas kyeonggiensis]MBB4097982.1 pimeloyl-ACP methyl ester carboxylesterase [Sphingomonas kyeonggiensis]